MVRQTLEVSACKTALAMSLSSALAPRPRSSLRPLAAASAACRNEVFPHRIRRGASPDRRADEQASPADKNGMKAGVPRSARPKSR